jgi:hypothetical protein
MISGIRCFPNTGSRSYRLFTFSGWATSHCLQTSHPTCPPWKHSCQYMCGHECNSWVVLVTGRAQAPRTSAEKITYRQTVSVRRLLHDDAFVSSTSILTVLSSSSAHGTTMTNHWRVLAPRGHACIIRFDS